MTFPSEPRAPAVNVSRLILGLLVLLIGIAWMLEIAGAIDDIPWGYLLPAAIIVIGLGLVADARGEAHGGLIALGVVLTVLLLIDVSVAPFRFAAGDTVFGPLTERPATVDEVEDYSLFAGDLEVDLSRLDLPVGETKVQVSLFAGEITVRVPDDVAVDLTAETLFGAVRALGEKREGIGPKVEDRFGDEDSTRVLVLDVSSFAGDIEARR